MGCSSTTSKIILTVIGFIFWAAAATLIFLGVWVYHTYQHFDELTKANLTLIPAGIVIVVGVFLFLIGSIGCFAACKENKCLLAVLFSLLLIVLTAEVTAGVLGYVFRDDMEKSVNDGLEDALDKYTNKTTVQRDQLDYLQRELKCCGINNSSDWADAVAWQKYHHGLVPDSCCNTSKHYDNVTKCDTTYKSADIYQDGCYDKLQKKFEKNLVYIAGVAISFAVVQLLGMLCSCILMCRSQEVRYEILGGPNSGLRV